MNTYRILALLSDASWSVHIIECENDAEAVLRAMNMGSGQMQVRESDRVVAEIRGTPREIREEYPYGGAA